MMKIKLFKMIIENIDNKQTNVLQIMRYVKKQMIIVINY